MLDNLGLVIGVYSTGENDFWGFIIDSVRMIVMLTEDKIHKLKDLPIFSMDNAHSLRIRNIARLTGHLV